MGYQQGADNLIRTKNNVSKTMASSNGATTIAVNGTRGQIDLTLSAEWAATFKAEIGPFTFNNSSIKADSCIAITTISNHALILTVGPYNLSAGSCKFSLSNHSLAAVADASVVKIAYMIFN